MLSIFKKWKWTNYVEGILLGLIGVLCIVFSSNEKFYDVIGYIIASVIILNGLGGLIFAILFPSYDIFGSICLVALGIWVFFYPSIFVNVLPVVLGIIIMLVGIYKLYIDLFIKRFSISFTSFLTRIVTSVSLIALGIIVLCFNGYHLMNIVLILIGVILLYIAILEVIDTVTISLNAKKIKKNIDKNVIDVEEIKDK